MIPGRLLLLSIGFALCSSGVQADDWPHWRGATRNGITSESSALGNQPWPAREPLWTANVGTGASSPIVWKGNVFCLGWKNGQEQVTCLDAATGRVRWTQAYEAPQYGRYAVGDQSMYRGSTATPEIDPETRVLFTLGCDGDLVAWDPMRGQELWRRNLYDDFSVPQRPQITKRRRSLRDYGYTTAPFATGNQVIVEVGSTEQGNLIAFEQNSGKVLWRSANRDPAGHSGGLAPITLEAVPCVAVATSYGLHVARIDGDQAGKTVAEFPWKTDFSNTIASVVVEGQSVLISSRYNQNAMARVDISLADGAREVWRNRYPTGVCTPVIYKGKIYYANKGVYCMDFATGNFEWAGGKIGDAGSCLLTKDERLLVWGNGGDLSLIESAVRSPDACQELEERSGIFRDMDWPHLVAADGRLFLKTLNGDVACFPLANVTK